MHGPDKGSVGRHFFPPFPFVDTFETKEISTAVRCRVRFGVCVFFFLSFFFGTGPVNDRVRVRAFVRARACGRRTDGRSERDGENGRETTVDKERNR